MKNQRQSAAILRSFGTHLVRYGLVVLLIWVGALKFAEYEAVGIQPLVANSPLMSFVYEITSVQTFAAVLGTVEIVLGVLIAMRPISSKLSGIGSLGAIVMFVTTLSFLVTTPGVWQPDMGAPFLTPMPGQFLAKDLVLLGAAALTAGEALGADSTAEPSRT